MKGVTITFRMKHKSKYFVQRLKRSKVISVQNLAAQRNAIVLQNSGLTPRIETLDVSSTSKSTVVVIKNHQH